MYFYYEQTLSYKNTHSFDIANFFLINCHVNEQKRGERL